VIVGPAGQNIVSQLQQSPCKTLGVFNNLELSGPVLLPRVSLKKTALAATLFR